MREKQKSGYGSFSPLPSQRAKNDPMKTKLTLIGTLLTTFLILTLGFGAVAGIGETNVGGGHGLPESDAGVSWSGRPQQVNPIYEGSREAATIIDIAMKAARDYMRRAFTENITEAMVIDEIVRVILENGGDPYVSAFWSGETDDTEEAGLIVVSGNDSSRPHGNYDDDEWKQIMPGEVVVIDIGARYQGRCSDETRTFFIGEPSEIQREIYAIVKEAHELAAKEIRQFLQVKELDKIARDYITEHGYGDDFLHSLGHGVGYYIHEPPLITQTSPYGEQPLRLWDVITIEPGIYIQNASKGDGEIFGIRIENDYGVGLNGGEKFTHFSTDIEDMIILPEEDAGDEEEDETFLEEHSNVLYGIAIPIVGVVAVAVAFTLYRKLRSRKIW